uniref:Putative secreted protein n=1 Tax=Anopheles darlingi TaxID=43151 RepID=A0A2M4D0W4_ANODA
MMLEEKRAGERVLLQLSFVCFHGFFAAAAAAVSAGRLGVVHTHWSTLLNYRRRRGWMSENTFGGHTTFRCLSNAPRKRIDSLRDDYLGCLCCCWGSTSHNYIK